MITPITLQTMDIVLMLFVGIGMPLISIISDRYFGEDAMKDPKFKLFAFIGTILILWAPTLTLLWFWIAESRALSLLGLGFEGGLWSYGTVFASLILVGFYYREYIKVKTDPIEEQKVRDQLTETPALQDMMPNNKLELKLMSMTAITAGITEEILYRGFLIWGLSLYTDIWVASLLSLFFFTLGHLYQKAWDNLMRVAGLGGLMTILTIASGSLYPAIVVHIIVDLVAAAIGWHLHCVKVADAEAVAAKP